MRVTFTRTGERRYRVSVEGEGVVSAIMDPAPGYDAQLPHDMAHFIVEKELDITGGIFGQLAAGGHASSFRPVHSEKRRKIKRKGDRLAAANRSETSLSEQVVYLAVTKWKNERDPDTQVKGVSREDIDRICRQFDAASELWWKAGVGGSVVFEWRPGQDHK